MAPFIMVYDVGTSSLKAVVYNEAGETLCRRSEAYSFSAAEEGWAEIDPHLWWQALAAATAQTVEQGIDLKAIRCIALTGQMHSAVLLGRDDRVLAPSILWLDRRSAAETEELQKRFALKPYKLNSSYTLPKLYWQSKHRPELLEEVATILWPKDFLRFLLTGEKATDYTEGLGSALIDWQSGRWLPERMEACGLAPEILPEIRAEDELFPILRKRALELGFSPDCRVLTGMGDIAALLGGAPHKKGRLVYSMGSSSMYFTEVDSDPGEEQGLYTLHLAGYTLFGGVSSTTGASLTWAHNQLWGGKQGTDFETMIQAALRLKTEKDPLLFFPFLAGERSPFWSDSLSGGFEGLKLHHTKAHLTLAVMEGIMYSIRYVLDLMAQAGVKIEELALAGGGASAPGWPQIIADGTDRTVTIYNAEDTVAAVLYAVAASRIQERPFREVLEELFSEPVTLHPDSGKRKRYRRNYSLYKRFLEAKLAIYERMEIDV